MRIFAFANLFAFCIISNAQDAATTDPVTSKATRAPASSTVKSLETGAYNRANRATRAEKEKRAGAIVQQLFEGTLRPSSITPDMVESVENRLKNVDPELFRETVVERDTWHSTPGKVPGRVVEDPVAVSLDKKLPPAEKAHHHEAAAPHPEPEPIVYTKSTAPPVVAEPAPKERKTLASVFKGKRETRQPKAETNRPKPIKGLINKLFKPREKAIEIEK